MDTSPGASTIVSADSLRAAALSTLKAKRRKPVSERPQPPLPSRPLPPSDSFALDYGQDEQDQDTSAQVGITPKLGVQEEKEKPAPVVEDVQMREEGEISEEDEPPPPPPPKQLPKQPPTRPRQLTRSPRPTPPALSEARRPLEVRLSPPIQPKLSTPETRLPAPVPALALVDRVSSALSEFSLSRSRWTYP
ncbi:hypothetical protein CPB84DRAFT_1406506 [Gymnopilus junonius]|uniref:Uncharacterized protein n=1 Tax=Gymnopilus junonius TaxID=109634 RepID=A0A9P5TJX0_GYMJU|nr:hypothetical protein CPB84DRAFT_1406506 [Gymnopilus junonius]